MRALTFPPRATPSTLAEVHVHAMRYGEDALGLEYDPALAPADRRGEVPLAGTALLLLNLDLLLFYHRISTNPFAR